MYLIVWRNSSIRKSLSISSHARSDSVKLFTTVVDQKKKFLDLAQQREWMNLEDYYKLTSKDLEQLGTWTRNKYNTSPTQFLSAMYPDHNWLPWKFESCPRNYWADIKNQRAFFDWSANQLKLQQKDDWYHVANQVMKSSNPL